MPSPLSPGASFGPFHLIKKLGSGGQAEVWAARKPLAGIERIFAVKLAWSENVDDPRLNELVLREARVLGLLAGHPNIIGVTEFGILPGCFYLQMDYAHGWDLQKILGRGTRFPVELALHIVACACAALEFAHSPHGEDGRRIIHRDIKPANILITHWGDVKLVDFGVAKLLSERQTITRIAGTLPYFPPEAYAIDSSPTPRYDIFALGAVLWECLAGTRLFQGDTDQEVVARTMACQIPSLSSYGVQLSPTVEWIVAKFLAKDPGERFQSAQEALAAIRNTPQGRAAGTYDLKMFLQATQAPPEDIVASPPATAPERLPLVSNPPSTGSLRGEAVPSRSTVTTAHSRARWVAAAVALVVAGAAIAGVTLLLRKPSHVVLSRPDAGAVRVAAPVPAPDARPRPGRVTLDVTPREASVWIDATSVPGPPFVATDLPVGRTVRVRIERPGYETHEAETTVGEDTRLVVDLRQIPPTVVERPTKRTRSRPPAQPPVLQNPQSDATAKPLEPKTPPTPVAKPPEKKPPQDKNAIKDVD